MKSFNFLPFECKISLMLLGNANRQNHSIHVQNWSRVQIYNELLETAVFGLLLFDKVLMGELLEILLVVAAIVVLLGAVLDEAALLQTRHAIAQEAHSRLHRAQVGWQLLGQFELNL